MNNNPTDFRDRLLAVESLALDSREKLYQELHVMFRRELTVLHRIFIGFVAVASLAIAGLCGYLAITQMKLPPVARIGLALGALFGLVWVAWSVRILRRGVFDIKSDSVRMSALVWVFTVLMNVIFLMVGMSLKDRLMGVMLIAYGLTFLIGAAVFWLTDRIVQSQLDTRERLLQIELRIAGLSEQIAANAGQRPGQN